MPSTSTGCMDIVEIKGLPIRDTGESLRLLSVCTTKVAHRCCAVRGCVGLRGAVTCWVLVLCADGWHAAEVVVAKVLPGKVRPRGVRCRNNFVQNV